MGTPASALTQGVDGLARLVDTELIAQDHIPSDPGAVDPLIWELFSDSRQSTALAAGIAALALGRAWADVSRLLARASLPGGPDDEARLLSMVIGFGGRTNRTAVGSDETLAQFANRLRDRGSGSVEGLHGAIDLLAFALAGTLDPLPKEQQLERRSPKAPFSDESVQSVRSSDPETELRLRRLRPIAERGVHGRGRNPESTMSRADRNLTSMRLLMKATIAASSLPELGARLKDVLAGTVPVVDPLTLATMVVVLQQVRVASTVSSDIEVIVGPPLEPYPDQLSERDYQQTWETYVLCARRSILEST